MNNINLPEECSKQWEVILLLLSSEEKKIDRTNENEIETMSYFCKNEGLRTILFHWLQNMKLAYGEKVSEQDTALKCDKISLLWRQKGNDKFRAKLYEKSYKCYSKSVVYAEHNGLMYTLAVANRSVSLLKMKKYKECLSDITLAMETGYPADQLHKLLLRQIDCYIELGQKAEARSGLSFATEHFYSLNLSATHASDFERNVKVLQKKLQNITHDKQEDEVQLPDCYEGANINFNAASSAIELRRSETAGRYVVANKNTRRGDVLFSEEPYAWVTLPMDSPACEMCCEPDINSVPCKRCSRSVYCGTSCRDRALLSFHRWECVGAQCNVFPTIGIAHLALRVLLLSASEGFPTVPQTTANPTTAIELFRLYADLDNIEIYKQETPAFYRMFNLVTNFELMNNNDYIQYALTATMLTIYLQEFTKFFDYLPSKVPYKLSSDQLELFVAALILRSLGQLVCNGHAVLSLYTVQVNDGDHGLTVTEREIRRATAIYPSAAMMNHSCDPNIINTFYKSRLIVRCAGELAAGAQVFNCYGPHRARDPTVVRRAQLRAQYMFTCTCTACNQTNERDSVLVFSAYACLFCEGPILYTGVATQCPQCCSEFQLDKALSVIDCADELAAQARRTINLEDRCRKMQASYKLKQLVWYRHHSGLRAMADNIARLYADLGAFSKSIELIKQNVQCLEYQFNSFSVEVAHELRKLSDVMLERINKLPEHPDHRDWCLEAHILIKKAIQLMELNYGSWEDLVKRLKEQEVYVASLLAERHTH